MIVCDRPKFSRFWKTLNRLEISRWKPKFKHKGDWKHTITGQTSWSNVCCWENLGMHQEVKTEYLEIYDRIKQSQHHFINRNLCLSSLLEPVEDVLSRMDKEEPMVCQYKSLWCNMIFAFPRNIVLQKKPVGNCINGYRDQGAIRTITVGLYHSKRGHDIFCCMEWSLDWKVSMLASDAKHEAFGLFQFHWQEQGQFLHAGNQRILLDLFGSLFRTE